MVAYHAHLMAVDARRRAELVDLPGLSRVAYVMGRESFLPFAARTADGAHIGVAPVYFDDAAAAPRRAAVMPEQFEPPGFLRLARCHRYSPFIRAKSEHSADGLHVIEISRSSFAFFACPAESPRPARTFALTIRSQIGARCDSRCSDHRRMPFYGGRTHVSRQLRALLHDSPPPAT